MNADHMRDRDGLDTELVPGDTIISLLERARAATSIAVGVTVVACAVAPTSAIAQVSDSVVLRRALEATSPNAVVRVELVDARLLTGRLVGAGTTGLELSGPDTPMLIPYADLARYWERRRAIREGLVIGGVVGASLGAAYGALLASTCETCTSDPSTLSGALGGALLVGGLGAAAAGIIGAAFSRWRLRWEAELPRESVAPVVVATVPMPGALPGARETGDLTLQLASGHARVEGDPSLPPSFAIPTRQGAVVGLLASLSFRAGRLGLGPEILLLEGTPAVRAVSGLIRVDLAGRDAGVAPYALSGLGGYDWEAEVLLTLPLGLGVSFGADRRWRAEARWHHLVHNGSLTRPTLLTLSAGRRFAW